MVAALLEVVVEEIRVVIIVDLDHDIIIMIRLVVDRVLRALMVLRALRLAMLH